MWADYPISHPSAASRYTALIYTTHLSSNSCELLLVSSRQPRGLFGELVLFMYSSRSLSALFLRACSGHSVNRACQCPPAFPCSLFSCAPAGTSWTDGYSSREPPHPTSTKPPPIKQKFPVQALRYISISHIHGVEIGWSLWTKKNHNSFFSLFLLSRHAVITKNGKVIQS